MDEQLLPRIAQRETGHDAVADAERAELVGISNAVLLEVAASEERAIITNNVKDFRPLAVERLA